MAPIPSGLPKEFPKGGTCYQYFRQWSEKSDPDEVSPLEQVLKKLVGAARQSHGRKEKTSCCIVEHEGYDAGKKVSGIKRHIAVDSQGLPHAIHVTTANVTDRAGAETFALHQEDLCQVSRFHRDAG